MSRQLVASKPYDDLLELPAQAWVVETSVSDCGDGYSAGPWAVYEQPPGVAVVEAKIDGRVVAIGVDSPGSGYRSPPLVSVSPANLGCRCEAKIAGPIESVTVSRPGSGYVSPPEVVLSGPGYPGRCFAEITGHVESVEVASGGSEVPDGAPVLAGGGGGSGFEAFAISVDGVVQSVSVVSGGGGYSSPPVLSCGSAVLVAKMSYSISAVRIADGGYYPAPPLVQILPASCVERVEILSGGSGYSSRPRIVFAGGLGKGAEAEPVLGNGRIDRVDVAAAGEGIEENAVAIITGGGGSGAIVRPVVLNGRVESVEVVSPGYGYSHSPSIVCGNSVLIPRMSYSVVGAVVSLHGEGYLPDYPPSIMFVGGGGVGAAATATVARILPQDQSAAEASISGSITHVEVTSPGSGYEKSPDISVTGGAMLQARIYGPVVSRSLVDPGSKYAWYHDDLADRDYSGMYPGSPLWEYKRLDLHFQNPSPVARTFGDSHYETNVVQSVSSELSGQVTELKTQPDSEVLYPCNPVVTASDGVRMIAGDFHFDVSSAQVINSADSTPTRSLITGRATLPIEPSTHATSLGGRFSAGESSEGLLLYGSAWPAGMRFSKLPSLEACDLYGAGAAFSLVEQGEQRPPLATVTSEGSEYTSRAFLRLAGGVVFYDPPAIELTIDESGSVSSATVTYQGSGFIEPPVVVVHGGGGAGCEIRINLQETSGPRGVASAEVASSGRAYVSAPSVSVFHAERQFDLCHEGQRMNALLETAWSGFRITCSRAVIFPFASYSSVDAELFTNNCKLFSLTSHSAASDHYHSQQVGIHFVGEHSGPAENRRECAATSRSPSFSKMSNPSSNSAMIRSDA